MAGIHAFACDAIFFGFFAVKPDAPLVADDVLTVPWARPDPKVDIEGQRALVDLELPSIDETGQDRLAPNPPRIVSVFVYPD